ncbi:MAG: hypothetical protein IH594_13255 [Bacteroidales bacterium]|nr:hypothetical protein [Bacteroidales bacterium]
MTAKFGSKLICAMLGHYFFSSFRQNTKVADKKRCDQFTCYTYDVCIRCGKLSEKSAAGNHEFSEFVEDMNDKCTLIRTCKICGITVKKTQHQGGIDLKKYKVNCEYEQICKGCGEKLGLIEMHRTFHTVPGSSSCKLDKICDLCGKKIGVIENHDFGAPFEGRIPVDPDDFYFGWVIKCKRCSFIEKA